MRVIRVDASSATILLTEAPAPKVRDRQIGEIAKDALSGEALMVVGVVFIDEGDSSLIQVAIPESGVTDGLTVDAPVSLPGSTRPYARHARKLQPWQPCQMTRPTDPPIGVLARIWHAASN